MTETTDQESDKKPEATEAAKTEAPAEEASAPKAEAAAADSKEEAEPKEEAASQEEAEAVAKAETAGEGTESASVSTEAAAEAADSPEAQPAEVEAPSKPAPVITGTSYGTGRRKRSTARVYLEPGTGKIVVNRRSIDDYFGNDVLKMIVRQPFHVIERHDFDLRVTVCGGGIAGQAGAIRHGVSRALVKREPELRTALKAAGFLTRDPREKERKKYGQKGARARFQFSKR